MRIKIFGLELNIKSQKLHEKIEASRFKLAMVSSLLKSGVLVGMSLLTVDVVEKGSFMSVQRGSEVFNKDFFDKNYRSPLPYA